ncbi:uncharacterized protein LOC113337192 [Papaver somniferum]|uniref:uncharacterized protein LOC113337192 n=1 Tax=Papaver somniferum TaxID=3469 RepID=UPI000E704315|nr:uncharacterized protein LOC113337192 [Papaver somniferum]
MYNYSLCRRIGNLLIQYSGIFFGAATKSCADPISIIFWSIILRRKQLELLLLILPFGYLDLPTERLLVSMDKKLEIMPMADGRKMTAGRYILGLVVSSGCKICHVD